METGDVPTHDPAHPEYASRSRKLLWKLDIYTVPPLTLLWLAAFIDRTNIGNARVAGLATDLKLHGLQFNTALAVFYVLYIVSELPSNYALKKFGGKVWLPLLVFCWGLTTTFSGWMSSYASLIVVRLLLGLFEGGLLPGIVLYLSTLYRRHELQFRVGMFYSASSLSGAFGGLLAFAIERMNGKGGRPGWAWIFILEGIATCLIALLAYLFLPKDLSSARFLTQEQRDFAVKRFRADIITRHNPSIEREANNDSVSDDHTLRTDSRPVEKQTPGDDKHLEQTVTATTTPKGDGGDSEAISYHEPFEWRELWRGFREPQVWMTGIAYMSICVDLYSYSLFLPTIVSGMGYKGASAQLYSAFPYLPASGLTVFVAYFSDRLKSRAPFILCLLPLTMAGYILAIITTSNRARYAAVFLMALGTYASVPAILCLLPNNVAGMTKRTCVTALQLMLCNLAGFVAGFVYLPDQAPRFIKGHSVALGFTILAWFLIAINAIYCSWENRQRAAGRRDGNVERWQRLVAEGKTRAPLGDRDPQFIYTI